MADELTKEQLEDYKEAFTLFNQVIESLILFAVISLNMYCFYGNVTEYEFIFLVTGRNNYHISVGNNHALIRLQPIGRGA